MGTCQITKLLRETTFGESTKRRTLSRWYWRSSEFTPKNPESHIRKRINEWGCFMDIARLGIKKFRLWDYAGKYLLNVELRTSLLQRLGKHPLGSLVKKIAVLRKKLSEWNFLLSNGIGGGWEWFDPMYAAWRFLSVKASTCERKECRSSESLPCIRGRFFMFTGGTKGYSFSYL